MPETTWMVRAGERGFLIDEFRKGRAVVGWSSLGDLTNLTSREAIHQKLSQVHPHGNEGRLNNHAGILYKFRNVMRRGDRIVTYDPRTREYLLGQIAGDYTYNPRGVPEYPNERAVTWTHHVSRDVLPIAARNTLGSTLTLFSLNHEVVDNLDSAARGDAPRSVENETERESLEQIKEDTQAKAHELIKDKVLELEPDELEDLVAAILRAMGYRTRVAKKGPDRGVDVIGSRDGLLLETPRIKVQVKHRPGTQMGSEQIRSFTGGLREGDAALYVSTGGFSKDALYEANRSNIPIMLVDLDELAELIVTHYENFDMEGRVLMPLVKLYWPAE